MRVLILTLAIAIVGCAGHTESGAIGQPLELRQYLPDSLRKSDAPVDSTYRQIIAVGPDSARVEIEWASFKHGSGRYLASVSARLVAPVQYDNLKLGDIAALKNAGTKFNPVESATLKVVWSKRGILGRKGGAMNFGFDAAGGRQIGPAE